MLSRMWIIGKNISVGKDVEKLEPLYINDVNVKWYSHFIKTVCPFSKCQYTVPIWSHNSILRRLFKGKHVHTKTCTQVFILALLIIAKKWKQPSGH